MRSPVRALTVIVVAATLLFSALPAFAHVTVRADTTEPGGFAKYTVRVPNEADDAATVAVQIQLPEGYEEARYQPLEGWDIAIADGVLTIEGGRIEPGEFQEFAFSARNPEQAGDVEFPAIQVYEDGEEVRWVGAADSDEPAPVVSIGAGASAEGDDSHGDADAGAEVTAEATAAAEVTAPAEPAAEEASEPADAPTEDAADLAAEPAVDEGDDGGSNVLSIIALVAALLGLGLGAAAFARTRTTPRT